MYIYIHIHKVYKHVLYPTYILNAIYLYVYVYKYMYMLLMLRI